VPTIVAESLVDLPDPLAGLLAPGPLSRAEEVLRSLARSVAPAEASAEPPPWLLPDQIAPFRRVVAAIERHRGALLADPVGSGKTYIALAVAAVLAERWPAIALVPATLKEQWRRTAQLLGVPLLLHTHEALSRGRLPASRARLVLVDESHRFRNPTIRRYRVLARWLTGKRVLLLSATPVVNRIADLGHQLRLTIRDDALAVRGIRSLPAMFATGEVLPAIGDVVLRRPGPGPRPATRRSELSWEPSDGDREILAALDSLALSGDPGTASLIRTVLWLALASSRPALAGALGRYARLLDHAGQATTRGRVVTRAEIRSFTDGQLDQLLLWEMLPSLSAPADLVLADRSALERLRSEIGTAPLDPRIEQLRQLLGDGRITLVFTSSRDTLEALRVALAELRPAWVTGAGSGVGHVSMERDAVLDLFRPGALDAQRIRRPRILLTTDVAAEGLDLQLAERVVHFDLPWTSVRVDQREGRAVRLGARAEEIELVHFSPWPELETRLRLHARLAGKRRLLTVAGLDDAGHWLFRWRAELAGRLEPGSAVPGFSVVRGAPEGWLVGLALDQLFPDGSRREEPAGLYWIDASGAVVEDPEVTVARLESLEEAEQLESSCRDQRSASRVLVALARSRLRQAQLSSWLAREAPPEQRALVRRLRRLAADAARQRDRPGMELADRMLDWLAGGVTAGEAARVAELASLPIDRLAAGCAAMLAVPRLRAIPLPRLTGIIRVCREGRVRCLQDHSGKHSRMFRARADPVGCSSSK
jgi:hypothetical protein